MTVRQPAAFRLLLSRRDRRPSPRARAAPSTFGVGGGQGTGAYGRLPSTGNEDESPYCGILHRHRHCGLPAHTANASEDRRSDMVITGQHAGCRDASVDHHQWRYRRFWPRQPQPGAALCCPLHARATRRSGRGYDQFKLSDFDAPTYLDGLKHFTSETDHKSLRDRAAIWPGHLLRPRRRARRPFR